MSTYLFGQHVQRARLGKDSFAKIAAIAAEHGAEFHQIFEAHQYKSWFSCRGLGEPFDRDRASRVLTAIRGLR